MKPKKQETPTPKLPCCSRCGHRAEKLLTTTRGKDICIVCDLMLKGKERG